MAKQLNVSLGFSADTSKVKAQLQDLQNQLHKLTMSSSNELGIAKDIEKASRAAAELSVHLQQATNQKTGALDFSKLNQSIKKSGTSLQEYGRTLQSLGPQGQQAFLSLAQAVANSEVPIRRTNALIKEMGTSLANTARWQLSSSMLHGFMGAVQSAYGYAQDLNESLNNIRIVTGQNVDQMAKFAKEANKAARALSATTTEYTNASLIYYQQGLNDQQVKERTDITIKMANVSRQSAETVSDQMTAVWNNFDNGSRSLEHYADVMTALGAATASSTEEISEGLNKFAAVAETVGLSYEYAASALATVTATTRQSADVVGTAFKTLFARLQDLELGKTLDDGTSLGKYSAALDAVGINIKDVNGGMKSMDTILDELGNKWKNLSKDTQVALAQTVAGTRQYTQLVALMDNWGYFQQNLGVANTSEGALQKQADIYAESWEAASDRVTAAAEEIYQSLINDEFFIDLLNDVEKVLKFIDRLIDNLGGLEGVLTAIGAVVTRVFSNQLAQGLSNMAYNVQMLTKHGRKKIDDEREDFINKAVDSIPQSNEYTTKTETAQQDSLRTQLTLQSQYMANLDKMSDIEAETNKRLMERTALLKEQTVELTSQKEAIEERISNKTMTLRGTIDLENQANPQGNQINYEQQVKPLIEKIKTASGISAVLRDSTNVISALGRAGEQGSQVFKAFKTDLMGIDIKNMSTEVKDLIQQINAMGDSPDPVILKEKIEELNFELEKLSQGSTKKIKTFVPKEARDNVDELIQDYRELDVVERRLTQTSEDSQQSYDATAESIKNAKGKQKEWSDVLVESANVALSAASAINMLGGMFDTLSDPDVSGWEKFTTILMTLGTVVPMLISAWKGLKTIIESETLAKIANTIATWANVVAEKALNKEKGIQARENVKNKIKDTAKDTVQKGKNILKKGKDFIGDGKNLKGKVKDAWDLAAYKKSEGLSLGAKVTKHKTGSLSIQGQKGFVSPKAVAAAGKSAFSKVTTLAKGLGGIAAGIAVVAVAISAAVKQANKAEEALKKAKQISKELNENYETVKATQEEFLNKASEYSQAADALKDMTEGTDEYREAVKKANEAAMELIETNGNLAYKIENGQIIVDEQSLANEEAESKQKIENSYAAKIAGQQQVRTAEENLKKRDLSRDKLSSVLGAGQGVANVAAMTAAGALAGSFIPVIGTAVGAVVGAIGGVIGQAIVGGTASSSEDKALEALESAYMQDETVLQKLKDGSLTDKEWEAMGINDTALRASLEKNADKVSELVKEMAANTNAINAQNDAIAANTLSDNERVNRSKYRDDIIDVTGDAYGHLQEAAKAEWGDTWGKEGIAKINGANKKAKEVFSEYLKYAGLEDAGYKLTDTTGDDKNRKFVYEDAEGNKKEISLEAMQATRAAYEANQQLDSIANNLAAKFNQLEFSGNASDQALLSFLKDKNFESATVEQFSTMRGRVGDSVDQAELANLLGVKEVTAEVAMQYGYESAEAMMNAFNTALSNADTAFKNINVDGLAAELNKNLTVATSKKFKNLIEDIEAGPMGEEAANQFISGMNTMLSGMDAKDQKEAMEKIANIDWSAYDAGKEVKDIIEELGGSINMTDEEFEQWVHNMNMANVAVPNAEQVIKDLNAINKLMKDTSLGDIISKEDYELLIKYNDELSKYFTVLADGTAQLTGDPLDAMQAMKQSQKEYLTNTIEASKVAQEALVNKKMAGAAVLGLTEDDDIEAWRYSAKGNEYTASDGAKAYYRTDDTMARFNKQMEFLKSQGAFDEEQYNKWKADLEGGEGGWETTFSEIDAAVNAAIDGWQDLDKQVAEAAQQQQAYYTQIAMSADDAAERQQLLKDGVINELAYSEAATAAMSKEAWEGLDVKEVEEYAEYLEETFDMTEEGSEEAARSIMKMNRGVENLGTNFTEWSSVLKKSSKDSEEYFKAMKQMKNSLSDILDVSEEFISNDFVTKNMADIEKAALGDADAIDRLKRSLADQIILDIFKVDSLDKLSTDIQSKITTLKNWLDDNKLEVGATVDAEANSDFLQACQDMVAAAGMTAEQANAYFSQMGFSTEFETEPQDTVQTVPITHTKSELVSGNPATGEYETKTWSWQDGTATHTGKVDAIKMKTVTIDGKETKVPQIKALHKNATGAMNNQSPKNPGGGSKSKAPKRHETVDRYKEINDQLDNVARSLSKANKEADKLWGPARLAKLKEIGNLLRQENALLKAKADLANNYLQNGIKSDQAQLVTAIKNNINTKGIDMNNLFGENGAFIGYNEVFNQLQNELEAAYKSGNSNRIEKAEEKKDALTAAFDLYEQTRSTALDAIEQYEDGITAIQEHNLLELTAKLDLKVEINDMDMKKLDYLMSKYDEDIYGMEERLLAMIGKGQDSDGNLLSDVLFGDSQLANYLENLNTYKTRYDELIKSYQTADQEGNREINQAQLIKELQQLQDNIYQDLGNVQNLDKAMKSYYSDTLAAANDELSKHTDKMQHHNAVLEHYSNLMGLLGHSKDYDNLGHILQAQVTVAKNSAAVSKKNYEMLTEQAAQRKAEWEAAQKDTSLTDEQRKRIEKNWEAAEAAAKESQDTMLSDAAAWAEAVTAEVENELSKLADILNKNLAGEFGSLDELNTSMERKNSLQEEYLTTTNKIYETDKMIRTAQQEIDKTTNTVAKKRLQNFIVETNQLKDQTKLSKYELDIQQAKYDLLLAEIALEEAQNAKSTVRLRRDSEGNFGYVYTADSNAVADAEQKVADAQNKLYNIGLDGANDYASKYAETVSEMNDEITALTEARMNGEIASEEEFQRKKEAIIAFYQEKLINYSHLYQTALGVDGRIVQEAWSSQFGSMTQNTEKWMQEVSGYANQVTDVFKQYYTGMGEIEQYTIGTDASKVAEATSQIVTDSQALAEAITGEGGVIDALKDELTAVSNLTLEYTKMKGEIDKAILAAETLAGTVSGTVKNEGDDNEDNNLGITNTTPPPATPPSNNTTTTTPGNTTTTTASTTTTTTPASTTSTNLVSYNNGGHSKSEVQAAQRFLNSKGASLTVDGKWGPKSVAAAKAKGYNSLDEVIAAMSAPETPEQPTTPSTSSAYTGGGGGGGSWKYALRQVQKFDTGGYTGSWGSYGKLAFLHEKEMVLTATQTEDLLASMELLDHILSAIDLYSANSQLGGMLNSPTYHGNNGETVVQQDVRIEASFPGVTDRNEIEEAFNNLVNRASQYANRK